MRKITVLLGLMFMVYAMFAHPPKKVVLKYTDGKILVQAPHKVKDVKKHYIDKLIVTINDGEEQEFLYNEQSSLQTADITLDLPNLKAGDVIKVKAKCNKSGAKAAEITIE